MYSDLNYPCFISEDTEAESGHLPKVPLLANDGAKIQTLVYMALVWTEMCPPPHPPGNSCVDAATRNVIDFGDRACEEVIKVN